MTSNESVPLGESNFFEEYKNDFEESFLPVSLEDMARMEVLTPEATAHVWQPDEVGRALFQWRRDHSTLGKKADVNFEKSVASAQQNSEMPRVIMRRFEQLRPDLYPLQRFLNCDIVYNFQIDASLKPSEHVAANDIYYKKSYERVKEWLQKLPLEANQQFYVARVPQETFLVTWQDFVYHWDGFYTDSFCTLNVIDSDPRWFLFLHSERIAVWGCTYEYAIRKGLNPDSFAQQPVQYHYEQEKAYGEAQTFRKIITAHKD